MSTRDTEILNGPAQRVFVPRSPGVEICVLRADPEGALTFLVRMRKGARAERHGHPGGEDTYIVSGRLRIDKRADAENRPRPDVLLSEGDYFFAPPGEFHEGFADEDCMLFVVAPSGIDPRASRS